MKAILIVLFLVAMFHLSLYYCNVDFFPKKEVPMDLSDIKVRLEKQLNELKHYDSVNTHG